jgi:hypothetical protein
MAAGVGPTMVVEEVSSPFPGRGHDVSASSPYIMMSPNLYGLCIYDIRCGVFVSSHDQRLAMTGRLGLFQPHHVSRYSLMTLISLLSMATDSSPGSGHAAVTLSSIS